MKVFHGMVCPCPFSDESTPQYYLFPSFWWSEYSMVWPVPVFSNIVKVRNGMVGPCPFAGQITPRYYLFLSFWWSNYSTVLPVPALLMITIFHGMTCPCLLHLSLPVMPHSEQAKWAITRANMSATYIQSKFMKRFTVKLGRMEMIRYYQNTPQHGLFLQYPPHTSLPFSLSKYDTVSAWLG